MSLKPFADKIIGQTEYGRRVKAATREVLRQALIEHGGNRTLTARTLGLNRTYLQLLIRHYRLAEDAPVAPRGTWSTAEWRAECRELRKHA